jgi:hypothetical protein
VLSTRGTSQPDGGAGSGSLCCTLTPTAAGGQQLDAVVVSASSRIGTCFEVLESEKVTSRGGQAFTIVTSVRAATARTPSAYCPVVLLRVFDAGCC